MPKHILCPFHKEKTASFAIYPDGFFCFGCHRWGRHKDLDFDVKPSDIKEKYVEPLKEKLEYINSLPTKQIRGFTLPYDDIGYYLLWPGGVYYIRRHWDTEGRPTRYYAPAGHPKPLYYIRNFPQAQTLVIIEGQFNALSTSQVMNELDVCSPGGTSDFTKTAYDDYLKYYVKYARIHIIVDADGAGAAAGIELGTRLLRDGVSKEKIKIHCMPKDANDVLVEDGPEKLKEILKTYLEM